MYSWTLASLSSAPSVIDKTMPKKEKSKPLVEYDASSDVLYIATRKGLEEEFTEVAPGVNVELDNKGNVLGVEILRASHTLKDFLKLLGKRHDVAS
jgi:uncharacterized protein YuzE